MADYRDILTGTLGKLADKVRDSDAVGSVTEVYAKGADRARAFGQITRLTLALNGEQEELNRVFAEIGRLYFEQAAAAPEGCFAPLFRQAERLADGIREKQSRIDALKARHADGGLRDIEVEIGDFDEVVSAAERDALGEDR